MKKIIIVDDSRTVRWLVRDALSGADFEVIEAQDGMEGLEKLDQNRDAAMMICDLNTPRMNGMDMIEAVLCAPVNGKLPLVVLTTEGQDEIITRAKQAGAKGWIVKPFQAELLLATVKRWTNTKSR